MHKLIGRAIGWVIHGYRLKDPVTGIKVEGPALTSRTVWGIILGTLGLAIKYALAPAVAGDTTAIDWSAVGTFVLTLASGLAGLGLIGKGHVLGVRADRLIRILMVVVADLSKVDLKTIPTLQVQAATPAPGPAQVSPEDVATARERLEAILRERRARTDASRGEGPR